MENENKSITIDQSSIIALKAELLRKQEEFRLKKLAKLGSTSNEYEINQTQSTWGKKKPAQTKVDLDEKVEKKPDQNESEEDSDSKLLEKSKKMLENKAKYYEDVLVGKKQTEEGDDELFLVDFDQKVAEKATTSRESNEPKFKLKREVDENAYNEEIREKWEREARENLDREAIHYANLRYDEIRNMGVGNYRFSTDEETRKAQMQFFKNIQSEAKMNRLLNEIYKLKRERSLIERLSKVKQRRLLKFGYTLEQIKTLPGYQSDLDDIDEEISTFENIIKNPDLIDSKSDNNDEEAGVGGEFSEERERNLEFKRRKAKNREWDKPKLKDKMWKNQVEKLRNERVHDFAPPKIYDTKRKRPKLNE